MKKILIIEDDKFLNSAYRLKLLKTGYDFKIAYDGEEALSLMESYAPDLILLDIVIPKKDGFETLKAIKAHDKWKDIPVIIVSNLGQEEDIERGIKLGALSYFVKTSHTLEEIMHAIDTQLSSEKTQNPNA